MLPVLRSCLSLLIFTWTVFILKSCCSVFNPACFKWPCTRPPLMEMFCFNIYSFYLFFLNVKHLRPKWIGSLTENKRTRRGSGLREKQVKGVGPSRCAPLHNVCDVLVQGGNCLSKNIMVAREKICLSQWPTAVPRLYSSCILMPILDFF